MGCGDDACPAFVGKRMIDWDLDNPKGKPIDEFRRVRDDIERRVLDLLEARRIGRQVLHPEAALPARKGWPFEASEQANHLFER
jgi:hypothetical protein